MQRLSYLLGAFFLAVIVIVAGAEWSGSFWRGALPIMGIVTIAISGFVFLASCAKKRNGSDQRQRFIAYGIGHKQARLERGRNPWPKRRLC